MKRAILMGVLAALLCAVAVEGQTASNQYQHIAWKWTAPTGPQVTCSATVTQACVKDYLLTLTDPTGVAGAPIAVAWPNTAYTFGPGGFLFCGTWKASLAVEYIDETSTLKSTAPATGSAVVPCPFVAPGSPNTLGGTPAP